jgi:uncharacterized protein
MSIRFEWDSDKATRNLEKHGVSFEEAVSAFYDSLSITIPDPDHSVGEVRILLIGKSQQGRTVVVAHTDREVVIRIINARLATRKERRTYEES